MCPQTRASGGQTVSQFAWCVFLLDFSSVKEQQNLERNANGRIWSQTKAAIRLRQRRKEHPQLHAQQTAIMKREKRLKRAIFLLETKTLRHEFKDRGDEFMKEYMNRPTFIEALKSKYFLNDSLNE